MIPEKINVSDSMLFMLSCREALAGIVEQSSMPMSERGRSKDFIFNEATDYQILSLVLKGHLPKQKYNLYGEHLLHMEFKEIVLDWSAFIDEEFGNDVTLSLLSEIGPLYPNYSSAVPIVEFLLSSKGKVVTEAPLEDLGGAAEKVNAVWNAFKNIPAVKAIAKDIAPGSAMRDSEVKKLIVKQLEKAGGKVDQAVQGMKNSFDKGWLQSKLEKLNKGQGSRYRAPEGAWDKIRIWAQHKSLDAKAAVNNAIQKAQQFSAQNPEAKYIAGAALAALAIFGAYKTYKRFFSKAAKACAGQADKKACMKKYKIDAIKAQIADLQGASSKCGATKDPEKCKAAIGNKINKLKAKAQKSMA